MPSPTNDERRDAVLSSTIDLLERLTSRYENFEEEFRGLIGRDIPNMMESLVRMIHDLTERVETLEQQNAAGAAPPATVPDWVDRLDTYVDPNERINLPPYLHELQLPQSVETCPYCSARSNNRQGNVYLCSDGRCLRWWVPPSSSAEGLFQNRTIMSDLLRMRPTVAVNPGRDEPRTAYQHLMEEDVGQRGEDSDEWTEPPDPSDD